MDMTPTIWRTICLVILICALFCLRMSNDTIKYLDHNNNNKSNEFKLQDFYTGKISHAVNNSYSFISTLYCRHNHKKIMLNSKSTFLISILLILSGDVEMNPGPRQPKYPCKICSKAVKNNDSAMRCDNCEIWVHNLCSGISTHTYETMKNSSCTWICPACGLPSFSSSLFEDNSILSSSNRYSSLENLSSTDNTFQLPVNASTPNKVKYNCNKPLKIISVNINSLRGKSVQMTELIHDEKPDIILCQETKIDQTVHSSELFLVLIIYFAKIDLFMVEGYVLLLIRNYKRHNAMTLIVILKLSGFN